MWQDWARDGETEGASPSLMIPLEPHFKNKKECELWPLTVLLIDRRKSREGFTRKEFQQSHSSLRQGTRSPEKLRVQHHMAKLVAGLEPSSRHWSPLRSFFLSITLKSPRSPGETQPRQRPVKVRGQGKLSAGTCDCR